MKHVLLFMLAAALLLPAPGCKSGGTEAPQSDIDSLVKLVPPTERHKIPSSIKFSAELAQRAEVPGAPPPPTPPPSVYNYMMNVGTASQYIQAMHKLFKNGGAATLPALDTAQLAWLVPANTLQKIVDTGNWTGNGGVNKPSPYVIFYIGQNPATNQLVLMYTGVQLLAGQGTNGTDSFTEVWYANPSNPNNSFLFDNGMPCPTCAGLGIHTKMGQMSSIIENFTVWNDSSNCPCTPCPTCSITPAGTDAGNVIQVQYGNNSPRFTYTFDATHQFSHIYDNDKNVTDSVSGYTINNVKETHELRLYYKQK